MLGCVGEKKPKQQTTQTYTIFFSFPIKKYWFWFFCLIFSFVPTHIFIKRKKKPNSSFSLPFPRISLGVVCFSLTGEALWSGFLLDAVPRAAQGNQIPIAETSPKPTALAKFLCHPLACSDVSIH